jgi:hyaluronoglucosaminidase
MFRHSLLVAVALAGCGGSSGGRTSVPPHAEAVDAMALYPSPLYQKQQGLALSVDRVCVHTEALARPEALAGVTAELVARAGLTLATDGKCDWPITFAAAAPALDADASAAWTATAQGAGADERYIVASAITANAATTTLFAETDRGAEHALAAALGMVDDQTRVRNGVLVDAPALAGRGLVEGFYGTPFTIDQRTCLMKAMVRMRQNVYLYGPKNDTYARDQWADPYPDDAGKAIAAAAAAAKARLIDFYWSISPGAPVNTDGKSSIQFSSPDDFARLTRKIDSVRALGVDRFALFIDDTNGGFAWPNDAATYKTDADAHADLANRLDDYVTAGDPSAHILFVGRIYTNQTAGWDYVNTLARDLHPGIEVMWTGPFTFSTTMTASDMSMVDQILGRKVVIWDNEPTVPGPLTGRSVDLPNAIGVMLSNPMMIELHQGFDAFWQLFGTLGDYQWNPKAYVSQGSYDVWQQRRGDCN